METLTGSWSVLVVDDDPDIVRVVERTLAGEGLEIRTAGSGEDAIGIAAAHRPHIVILDVNMPGMDGFEVCARLRADPVTAAAAVVFLTGLGDADNRLKGIESGADEYLTKPFQPREILARVRTLLRLQGLRASLAGSLQKVRRFSTFVENVTMGIGNSVPGYDALERLIVGHVLGSAARAAPMAAALAVGREGGTSPGTVRMLGLRRGRRGCSHHDRTDGSPRRNQNPARRGVDRSSLRAGRTPCGGRGRVGPWPRILHSNRSDSRRRGVRRGADVRRGVQLSHRGHAL
ncbi:MAG: response regulator [Deltaproteobacteria bacterium]|nr:response regulator [Deltaproteobacteria bacterium]